MQFIDSTAKIRVDRTRKANRRARKSENCVELTKANSRPTVTAAESEIFSIAGPKRRNEPHTLKSKGQFEIRTPEMTRG